MILILASTKSVRDRIHSRTSEKVINLAPRVQLTNRKSSLISKWIANWFPVFPGQFLVQRIKEYLRRQDGEINGRKSKIRQIYCWLKSRQKSWFHEFISTQRVPHGHCVLSLVGSESRQETGREFANPIRESRFKMALVDWDDEINFLRDKGHMVGWNFKIIKYTKSRRVLILQ